MLPRAIYRVVFVVTLLAPATALAGGFEVPDQSAVAGGAGGTGTARRGDPSSAWYQPAEVADGRGFRAGLGLTLALPTITAVGLEGSMETASTVAAVSTPPNLHLSYAQDEWAIGAYIGVSHGSSVSWPEGWWGRFEAMQTGLLGIRVAPFAALRLGGERGLIEGFPDVRISVGVHVDTVRLESQRALDFIDQEGRVQLLLWGAGVGGDASIYYQATEQLAFGVTYKSRTWMRLEGDADFTVPDPFVGRAPDQRASAELTIPDRLVFGVGWQTAMYAIYADVGVTFWSVRQRTQIDFEREVTSDIDVPQNWRDAVALRIGGEASPIPELQLRAGLFFDQEVGPDDTLAASSPDMARLGITVGAGVDITEEFGVDVYYSYVAFLGRDSTSLDAALASYSGELHLVGLNLRVVVGGSDAEAEADADADAEAEAEPDAEADAEAEAEDPPY